MASSSSLPEKLGMNPQCLSSIGPLGTDCEGALERKIQPHAEAALRIIMQAQDNHPHFQISGLKAHQLMPLSTIKDLPQQPRKDIASNPILSSLSPDQIAHLTTLLERYPSGIELNLPHFLGMVILDSCKDRVFKENFSQEFYKFSLTCFFRACASKSLDSDSIKRLLGFHPETFSTPQTLYFLNLKFLASQRTNPEREDLCSSLALFNRIIHLTRDSLTPHDPLLAADQLKDYFFNSSSSKTLHDFSRNLDLAINFLNYIIEQKKFLPENGPAYTNLLMSFAQLRGLCIQSLRQAPRLNEIFKALSSLSESTEKLLITSNQHIQDFDKQHQSVHDHSVVSMILTIAGPLLPLIESLYPELSCITLLERIERLFNAQSVNLDPSPISIEDQTSVDAWRQLSVFDETGFEEIFQSQLQLLHHLKLFTFRPSYILKISIAKRLVSCIKDTQKYCKRSSEVVQKLALAASDENSVYSITRETYFGLLGCLFKFYLLRDIHHLQTGENRSLAHFIPQDLRILLDNCTKDARVFSEEQLEILQRSNLDAAPIHAKQAQLQMLVKATLMGDVQGVTRAIENKANINLLDSFGLSPLFYAATSGQLDCLKALIKAGAEINSKGCRASNSALLGAVTHGHVHCLKALIEAGADINVLFSDYNVTALMVAAEEGRKDCLEALIEAGADIDRQCTNGLPALMFAIRKNKINCVRALIKAGANLNLQNQEGLTALMIAVVRKNLDCVQALIKADANLDLQCGEGVSALMLAVVSYNPDCVQALIEAGANLDLQDQEGLTALMESVHDKRLNSLKALIKAGANLDLQNKEGLTALMLAAQTGSKKCFFQLMNAGAHLRLDASSRKALLDILEQRGILDWYRRLAAPDDFKKENDAPTANPAASQHLINTPTEMTPAKLARLAALSQKADSSNSIDPTPSNNGVSHLLSSGAAAMESDTNPPFVVPQSGAAAEEIVEDSLDKSKEHKELRENIVRAKNYTQVASLLKNAGFIEDRSNGHIIFKGPSNGIVVVPMHSHDRPPIGTLRSIAEQAINALEVITLRPKSKR